MSFGALCLVVVNFIAIGLLPVVFFTRSDGFNAMWWVTAWPFFVTPVLLLAGYFEFIYVWSGAPWLLAGVQTVVVTVFSAASIALISLAVGSHRIPLSLWHQKDDAPVSIVQHGAYSRIRHPFYTAFLLAFSAALVLMPGLWTGAILLYSFAVLNFTASREERNLLKSDFGEDYAAYLSRTGRFWPRFGKR